MESKCLLMLNTIQVLFIYQIISTILHMIKMQKKAHICFNSTKETLVYGKNINTPKQVFYFQVVNIDSNQMKSIIKMHFISSLYGFL